MLFATSSKASKDLVGEIRHLVNNPNTRKMVDVGNDNQVLELSSRGVKERLEVWDLGREPIR